MEIWGMGEGARLEIVEEREDVRRRAIFSLDKQRWSEL